MLAPPIGHTVLRNGDRADFSMALLAGLALVVYKPIISKFRNDRDRVFRSLLELLKASTAVDFTSRWSL